MKGCHSCSKQIGFGTRWILKRIYCFNYTARLSFNQMTFIFKQYNKKHSNIKLVNSCFMWEGHDGYEMTNRMNLLFICQHCNWSSPIFNLHHLFTHCRWYNVTQFSNALQLVTSGVLHGRSDTIIVPDIIIVS